LGWRLFYYGHPLPNAYYVRATIPFGDRLTEGLSLLGAMSVDQRLLVPLLILAACGALSGASWLMRRRVQPYPLRFEFVVGIGLLLHWLYIGGDPFRERFLLLLYPLGILLAFERLERFRYPRLAVAAGLVLLAAIQLSALRADPRFEFTSAEKKYDRGVQLGRFLRQEHPHALLAADAMGKVPFFSGLRTIDMLGRSDRSIAHRRAEDSASVGLNRTDSEYVLNRKPDLIAVRLRPNLDGLWGLTRSRYLEAGYRIRYLVYTGREKPSFWLFDASLFPLRQRARLYLRGYTYGVLQHIDSFDRFH